MDIPKEFFILLLLLPATFMNVNCQSHEHDAHQPTTPTPEMTHHGDMHPMMPDMNNGTSPEMPEQGGMPSDTHDANSGSSHQSVRNSTMGDGDMGDMTHHVTPSTTDAPSSGGDGGHGHEGHDHEGHDHGGPNAPPPQAPSNNDETMTSDGSDDHSNHDAANTVAGGSGAHGNHGAAGLSAGGHYGFFHLTTNAVLLFEQWKTTTWQEMLGACFAFGIAAIFYEGLKKLRQSLHEHSRKTVRYATMNPSLRHKIFDCMHVLQSFLHMVQVVYSYFLMLAFMTFNVWICIGIALGAGIGYFLFGFDRHTVEDADEHCT